MVGKLCLRYCLLFVILCVLLAARPVWASSTGLNNIPTADVVPERVLARLREFSRNSSKFPCV